MLSRSCSRFRRSRLASSARARVTGGFYSHKACQQHVRSRTLTLTRLVVHSCSRWRHQVRYGWPSSYRYVPSARAAYQECFEFPRQCSRLSLVGFSQRAERHAQSSPPPSVPHSQRTFPSEHREPTLICYCRSAPHASPCMSKSSGRRRATECPRARRWRARRTSCASRHAHVHSPRPNVGECSATTCLPVRPNVENSHVPLQVRVRTRVRPLAAAGRSSVHTVGSHGARRSAHAHLHDPRRRSVRVSAAACARRGPSAPTPARDQTSGVGFPLSQCAPGVREDRSYPTWLRRMFVASCCCEWSADLSRAGLLCARCSSRPAVRRRRPPWTASLASVAVRVGQGERMRAARRAAHARPAAAVAVSPMMVRTSAAADMHRDSRSWDRIDRWGIEVQETVRRLACTC